MSVESSSSISSFKASNKQWEHQREMSSGQSTESEGPFIVVDDMSSDSNKGAAESYSNNDVSQKLHLMSLSEKDSMPSSCSEITSEGGDSEAEKRSVTPSTNIVLMKFLEDILSDEGLSQDLFLLKHLRKHRHGFVSLKLLAGYKQVKKMACDWQSLSLAARHSNLLEVNVDGRKVRRKTPLPDTLLNLPPSRVIAAINIPENMMTIEKLATTFGKYGSVSSLHLIKHKPGCGVPEALEPLIPSVPEVSYTNCTLVQYENVWGVARALKEFTSSQVTLHVLHEKRKTPRSSVSIRRTSIVCVPKYLPSQSPSNSPGSRRKNYFPNEWKRHMLACKPQPDSTGSESEELELMRRKIGLDGRKSRASCPNIRLANRSFPSTYSLPSSPHISRKIKETKILRDPKGPDGTRGFNIKKNAINLNYF